MFQANYDELYHRFLIIYKIKKTCTSKRTGSFKIKAINCTQGKKGNQNHLDIPSGDYVKINSLFFFLFFWLHGDLKRPKQRKQKRQKNQFPFFFFYLSLTTHILVKAKLLIHWFNKFQNVQSLQNFSYQLILIVSFYDFQTAPEQFTYQPCLIKLVTYMEQPIKF